LSRVALKREFAQLISELEGADFRNCIAEKFAVDLTNRPTTITLRGYSRDKRDGLIHADSKSKPITVLLYFNPTWTARNGRLRVLNSEHMEDCHVEVPPTAGTRLIFKVTYNCWCGYPSFEGIRRAIQLNYLVSQKAAHHDLLHHRLSAKKKAIKKVFTIDG